MIATIFVSCDTDNNPTIESFDKTALLTHWVDDIIIPAYENYNDELQSLKTSFNDLQNDKTFENFVALQTQHQNTLKAWQAVSIFEVGKAESLNLRLFTNIFPVDTALINKHISTEYYNLELPSTFDAQGLQALDYLLNSSFNNNLQNYSFFNNEKTCGYTLALIERMALLTNEVLNDWQNNYRREFIANTSSSATGSVSKLVNDFLFYYEKYFRAGKIGIPAGVFSGSAIPNKLEAYYERENQKQYALLALDAIENFYKGSNSLEGYILHNSEQMKIQQSLNENIKDHLQNIRQKLYDNTNFYDLLESDQTNKMLEIYDEMQKLVPLLKVDMMQLLNIQVDFVDADGD